MHPEISVIIKTHNPKIKYLDRVLAALKAQTLPLDRWELLVIDNASTSDLKSELDLSWHPHSRCVREERLGTVYALLCGIQASKGDVVIVVDDDNVLDRDYLEIALTISHNYPNLGTWGGQNIPEFEEQPPIWTKPFWRYLALRELKRDQVLVFPNQPKDLSGLEPDEPYLPYGAGGCYRRAVADAYFKLVTSDSRRTKLGRKGSSMVGGEDYDMGCTAYDLGLGSGLFQSLQLTHLISPHRLNEQHILKLIAGSKYTDLLLVYIRGQIGTVPFWKHLVRLVVKSAPLLFSPKAWRMKGRDRKFYLVERKSSWLAMIEIFRIQQSAKAREIN
jgi:glycosyltransferase involved in cell wall biosynthesis